jgi:hypothetical protein
MKFDKYFLDIRYEKFSIFVNSRSSVRLQRTGAKNII